MKEIPQPFVYWYGKLFMSVKKSIQFVSNFGRNSTYSSKYCFTGKMPGTVGTCRGLRKKLSSLQRLKQRKIKCWNIVYQKICSEYNIKVYSKSHILELWELGLIQSKRHDGRSKNSKLWGRKCWCECIYSVTWKWANLTAFRQINRGIKRKQNDRQKTSASKIKVVLESEERNP